MQKIINSPITLHDKDIISLTKSQDKLEVVLGENSHQLLTVIFEGVIGFYQMPINAVQGLVEEISTNEFMENVLSLNYDSSPIIKDQKYPGNHPYKRYVLYSSDQGDEYSEPALEVVAKDVKIEGLVK